MTGARTAPIGISRLSHPDYTVGPGITPGLLTLLKQALAG